MGGPPCIDPGPQDPECRELNVKYEMKI